jgi:hypothetical protein
MNKVLGDHYEGPGAGKKWRDGRPVTAPKPVLVTVSLEINNGYFENPRGKLSIKQN